MKQPLKSKTKQNTMVSIILPVYNADRYLEEALDSILSQTYENWELIAINDCSHDESYSILRKYKRKDKRIRVFQNKRNMGIGWTLNRGIHLAKGRYLARMDADDICFPERLERQVQYFQHHEDVSLVGTFSEEIDESGTVTGPRVFPTSHADIVKEMFVFTAIQHPTVMIDRERMPTQELWYNGELSPVEDLDFYFRNMMYAKFANIPEYLLYYRKHATNSSLSNVKKTFALAHRIRFKAMREYNYKPTVKHFITHFAQAAVVTFLPNFVLYDVYKLWRSNMIQNMKGITEKTVLAVRMAFISLFFFLLHKQ
jgi:glycosyltransferase involved in cell wall biosynthesis